MTGFTEEEFTGFARKHYRIAGGPAWEACNDYRALRQAVSDKHHDYAKSVGGIGFYAGNDENVGNASPISGVIFAGDLPTGWKRRNWSSQRGLKSGQVVGWPHLGTKAGRAILADIKRLPLLPSSNRVCAAIGFPHSLSYEGKGSTGTESLGFFETAKIGWLQQTFYLSLPDYAGQRAKKEAEGYIVTTPQWSPLDGMESVLKEQVDLDYAIARQAEAAAKQDRAA